MLQELLKKSKSFTYWHETFETLFVASLALYLLLFLIEEFAPGFAVEFLSMSWVLGLVIVSGVGYFSLAEDGSNNP